jgi:hypothetical protein
MRNEKTEVKCLDLRVARHRPAGPLPRYRDRQHHVQLASSDHRRKLLKRFRMSVRRVEHRLPGFRLDYTSKPNMNNFTKILRRDD